MDLEFKTLPDPFWNPGNVAAIAGSGYCVIGSNSIPGNVASTVSVSKNKLFRLAPNAILGLSSSKLDALALHITVQRDINTYNNCNSIPMSMGDMADAVAKTMNRKVILVNPMKGILAGLDEKNQGVLYCVYDNTEAIEKKNYGAIGPGNEIMNSILQQQINFSYMPREDGCSISLTPSHSSSIVVNALNAAKQMNANAFDDNVEVIIVNVIKPNGITVTEYPYDKKL